MGKWLQVSAMMAAGILATEPCAAQTAQVGVTGTEPSVFASLSIRLPIGAGSRSTPSARLQVTNYSPQDSVTGLRRDIQAGGIELGLLRSGKPSLYLNGQTLRTAQAKLGLGGSSGTTALIAGGVLLTLVVVAVAAGGAGPGDTCPTIDGSRDHCINP